MIAPLSIPISALEHWAYCPRQCALIHVEQAWEEDGNTARGRVAHERVDAGSATTRAGVREVRSLPLFHDDLGLHGIADLVEFGDGWIQPVEYKIGAVDGSRAASVQLAAQALCIESMFSIRVNTAALYSVSQSRRVPVEIDDGLRQAVATITAEVRACLEQLSLPTAPDDARCKRCSLNAMCMPSVTARTKALRNAEFALFDVA